MKQVSGIETVGTHHSAFQGWDRTAFYMKNFQNLPFHHFKIEMQLLLADDFYCRKQRSNSPKPVKGKDKSVIAKKKKKITREIGQTCERVTMTRRKRNGPASHARGWVSCLTALSQNWDNSIAPPFLLRDDPVWIINSLVT